MIITHKKIGETPLECLERIRISQNIPATTQMTYAGRLDPMAEGVLIVLTGDECKDKEKYLGLDKEYEMEVVFGVRTDTYDALGLVIETVGHLQVRPVDVHVQKYVGKFNQPYPPYSSKTVNGVQLHQLARENELPDKMPEKEVEIYSIEEVGEIGDDIYVDVISAPPLSIKLNTISATDLKARIFAGIDLVKGDFRQEAIKKRWEEVLGSCRDDICADVISATPLATASAPKVPASFPIMRIKVCCSSGTYMRSLAERMGKDSGTGAFALSIRRIKVGDFCL